MTANTTAQLKTANVFLHLFDLSNHNKQYIPILTNCVSRADTNHTPWSIATSHTHTHFLNNMKVTFSVNDKSSLINSFNLRKQKIESYSIILKSLQNVPIL